MYDIEFSESARKQFKKLEKCIQIRIADSLERIRIRPEKYISKIVANPFYCLRVGDYRIILDLDQGKLLILVIKIGHRGHIYSKL